MPTPLAQGDGALFAPFGSARAVRQSDRPQGWWAWRRKSVVWSPEGRRPPASSFGCPFLFEGWEGRAPCFCSLYVVVAAPGEEFLPAMSWTLVGDKGAVGYNARALNAPVWCKCVCARMMIGRGPDVTCFFSPLLMENEGGIRILQR